MDPASLRNAMNYLKSILACLLLVISGYGQMVDPAIDRSDEPFSYFAKPTDVLGVMDAREGTLVTPEGYLYCGAGELIFFTGNPPVPVEQRVKTLRDGYLPVIEYKYHKDGIDYFFTMVAVTLNGNPGSPLVNLVRILIKNNAMKQRMVRFSTAMRYQNDANTDWGVGDNRFGRPIVPERTGAFEQAGDAFDLDDLFEFDGNSLLKNGRILYSFSGQHVKDKILILKQGYNEEPFRDPMTLYVLPTTPFGIVQYEFPLAAKEMETLEFKMPYLPLDQDQADLGVYYTLNFGEAVAATGQFWNGVIDRGIDISIPEAKVVNTFKASLVYDLIARDKIDGKYYQKVNEFQYDSFWIRDAAYISHMYNISGYHEFARQVLAVFPDWQKADGNFVSQNDQFDGWGQVLWAFGQHYRYSGDREFITSVWPSIRRAFDWLTSAREMDPKHLMPATTPGDNELITGHVTGHNIWALAGLKNIIWLAEEIGESADAARFRAEYDDYFTAFMINLKTMIRSSGGYIPPGLDSLGGCDWGNLLSVYPEQILEADNPMVTATLEHARGKYQEGIMTYDNGRYLHHYLTIRNINTALILGQQEQAIKEFYDVLAHTSSTHAGFEFTIRPWGDRDFGMNLSPHGWFASEYRTVLRNMLVREEGNDLHLLSALSPEWLQKGETIAIKQAPTAFGTVNFEMVVQGRGAVLTMDNNFSQTPENLLVHIPWFVNFSKIIADRTELDVSGAVITVPPGTKEVIFRWKHKPQYRHYSYRRAVKNYLNEYQRKYIHFTNGD